MRELTRGNGFHIGVIAVLALLSTGATLGLPMIAATLVEKIQLGEDLSWWTAATAGAGLGTAAAGAVATFLLSRIGQRLICRLRIRTMTHSLGLTLADARREGTGNLVTRLTADAMQFKAAIDIGPIQLPMAALTLVGTMVIMGLLDWVLLLITVASFLTAVLIVALVITGLRRKYLALQEEVGLLVQHFVAALEALTVIKACRAERKVAADLAHRAERVEALEADAARMESLMVPVITLGQQIALVGVIVGGGARILGGQLDLATFIAFLLYLLQLTAPLIMAASGVNTLQAGLVARKRFNDVFALPFEDVSTPAPRPAGDASSAVPAAPGTVPAVRFERVSFGYEGREPALREVDLTVPDRGLTALVGLSGSGKSTVLGLVERFMTPDSGRVHVLGRDLTAWPLRELRGNLAYVDQSFTLLRDSVRNNLTIGHDTPPEDDDLLAILGRVGLREEVQGLPQGLDTVLGESGDLSGGQRQRLALARAALTDARLVLLDEPSSQLDSVNEQRLRAIVDELAAERAVLVVAHRISTVQHADHVIILDAGRVVDQGSHHELLLRCPQYAELVSGQLLSSVPSAPVPST
ncbi:ABC transporter ATP-binding protein [Kitasatospora purpeofusca]|uniref:ABC transporter ATP-binding protein n=1 Tax=Kitasatospora purpeofusca TaxID=67352 RepID=UPI00364991B3